MYWGRIGIELFKGAMISRPSDRLGLFAILVNEAANYSTKPASCTLWLTEATARANEKTPGREARGLPLYQISYHET